MTRPADAIVRIGGQRFYKWTTHPHRLEEGSKDNMAANRGIHRFMAFMLIVVAATPADYVTVEFTKTLNVASLSSASYTAFIKELRLKLAYSYVAGVPNVPVLPVLNDAKPRGFDLVMTDGAATTTVRFRRDNLYLIGFQMQTGKQDWYEFKPDKGGRQLIKNSKDLGFGGGYPALEEIAGKVTSMEINQAKLITSVQDLAGSDNKGKRAKALIVVIQMISEASRFIPISDHFASNLAKNAKLPEWMRKDLENNWDDISKEVLKWDADTSYKIQPFTINKKKITTVEGLRPYLGILYRGQAKLGSNSRGLEFEARPFGPMMVAQA